MHPFQRSTIRITNNVSGPTREDVGGTSCDVRSFRDPADNINLCCNVILETLTRGDLNLKPNLAMLILQCYDSDLDANGEGSITCCTE